MSRCFGDQEYDEPWNRPEPCATSGCDGTCDNPSSAFCYACRVRELEARAAANDRHVRERAADATSRRAS